MITEIGKPKNAKTNTRIWCHPKQSYTLALQGRGLSLPMPSPLRRQIRVWPNPEFRFVCQTVSKEHHNSRIPPGQIRANVHVQRTQVDNEVDNGYLHKHV